MNEVVEAPKRNSSDSPEEAESALEVSINYDPPPPDSVVISHKTKCMSKYRILKNLYVLGGSLFLFFLSFVALANLQSTLNSENGVGTEAQALIYAASMASSLLLPELFVKMIGCKKTLILTIIGSIPYIAANVYPCANTLMPTALLFGLSAGPLSASQSIYTQEMARLYHEEFPMEIYEVIVARFFGIFYFFASNTQIWGNLIAYYVLRPSVSPILLILDFTNETHCGVQFNKSNQTNSTNPNLVPPTEEKRFLLVAVYVFCGILSILLMLFFMDPLENDVEKGYSTKNQFKSVMSRLAAAAKHVMNPNQTLLVPLSIFCGLEISSYTSEFTQAYVACSWGVYHVGFVSISFGVCGALMSVFVGPLVKCFSQMSVILLAAFLNLISYILLLYWQPSPDVPVAYFAFSGVWGMTNVIWWSQVAALYGLMFPDDREAAFSNFSFWSFLGFFMSYSYANYLTVAVKIYILIIFLIVGITLYLIGQIRIKYFLPRSGYLPIGDSDFKH